MLNFGNFFRALRDKKINVLTLVLSEQIFLEQIFLNEANNHNPSSPAS